MITLIVVGICIIRRKRIPSGVQQFEKLEASTTNEIVNPKYNGAQREQRYETAVAHNPHYVDKRERARKSKSNYAEMQEQQYMRL